MRKVGTPADGWRVVQHDRWSNAHIFQVASRELRAKRTLYLVLFDFNCNAPTAQRAF